MGSKKKPYGAFAVFSSKDGMRRNPLARLLVEGGILPSSSLDNDNGFTIYVNDGVMRATERLVNSLKRHVKDAERRVKETK